MSTRTIFSIRRLSGWASAKVVFAISTALSTAGTFAAEAPVLTDAAPLVVSGPQHVQDTTLRSGQYWGKWNFGESQFLQVGFQPSTVYDTYHTVSLIRFDLAGLQYLKVRSARLRLYFPRNLIQQEPVAVHIYAVNPANAGWREGASEADEQPAAASWNGVSKNHPWSGGAGLSRAGADYGTEALDTKTVDGLNGEWVEFTLPEKLVQSWMDAPDKNAGLLLKTDDDARLGQSTYIYSSEHWSGKGPQLVLTGEESGKLIAANIFTETNHNTPFQMPPMGPVYRRWLEESPSRYAVWAQDKTINLTGRQALYPYLWDIVYRADIILPKAMLPLSDETEEIPQVIAAGNRTRARQILEDFMKYMMVFDYARDQNWYDSGPTADVLSPLQVAQFFVKSDDKSAENGVHGIYSQYDDGRWSETGSDSDNTEAAVQAQLKTIRERLKPTSAQMAKIEAVIRENMPQEKLHAAELKKNLDTVRKLIAQHTDGVEMLRALRGMFFHHRLFLIHQSLFSVPKYSVLMENGDMLAYAQWFYDVRHGQYSHDRIGRQLEAATRFMWRPSGHQEAEYADFQNCQWSDAVAGFSGTGFVTFNEKAAGHIDWQTDIPSGGVYRLSFRYSLSGTLDKSLEIAINGTPLKSALAFSTTSPNTWANTSVTVDLLPGKNEIQLRATSNGGPALDYLDVEPIRLAAGEAKAAQSVAR